ncbi:tRNA (guanine-N(1)-)-methyltransferase [Candidatus Cyrtobacter comes]|uniref:tRNA (guanine-N(1)-)-methyltransferase n=1 Tax=Candidatus Cyrtobacter comes TaxID=675776 RepID=A0ABU5L6T7_9RICK|nr:tRNA (guanosine(37)-N1)-methyltransferase TrmD [Candidatus Cyrtobacter comes]MDZ5761833.1 tRNA (guanine-N(1)-)-methyltransferase [Candidatus Cyrtobacter comes]
MWQVRILTLFPEVFPGPLNYSVTGRAMRNGIYSIEPKSIRDYSEDKHSRIDDTPYGGGDGMVIKADVLGNAIEGFFLPNGNPVIYLSPRGKVFNQDMAKDFISKNGLNLICGRFEGIDERVIQLYKITQVSLGDFLLSCGDVAAFPLLDSCIRLLPGCLGNPNSAETESFSGGGLLEHPHYTRPRVWRGLEVPSELTSGNHEGIALWRRRASEEETMKNRPDIWKRYLEKKNEFAG